MIPIINFLFLLFDILIIGHVILSWVRVSPYDPTWGPMVRFINRAAEPFLSPIRRLLPPMGGLDFSPLILLILSSLLQRVLVSLLR